MTVLTDAYAMNLTLAIPSLNRCGDENPPPLDLPSFDEILRFGILTRAAAAPSELYRRFLWQGSLLDAAKQKSGIAAEQAAVFASPVWQQMGMHQVSVIDGAYIQIQTDEAERLCGGLTEFYRHEGWQFHPLRPDLWLVTLPRRPAWHTAPVFDICGPNGDVSQAGGEDALQWLGMQTEIQMYLHNHPVNAERTAQKIPAVNGLWLWQDLEGTQSARPLLSSDCAWADFYPGERTDAPYDFEAWQAMLNEAGATFSDGLIFLDDLVVTGQTGDTWAYRDILESWEARWFAPLRQALDSGRLKSLTIVTDGENGGSLRIRPHSKRAFWKRKRKFDGIW